MKIDIEIVCNDKKATWAVQAALSELKARLDFIDSGRSDEPIKGGYDTKNDAKWNYVVVYDD